MDLISRSAALDALRHLPAMGAAPVVPEPLTPPMVPAVTVGSRLLARGSGTPLFHEYATVPVSDVGHRAYILLHPGGALGLHLPDGSLYRMLPSEINHSSQPRWRRKRPDCFVYLYLNQLREYDVAADKSTTLHEFSDLANINGRGESDISEDDDHLVLCSGQYVFVYEISSGKKTFQMQMPDPFDNLYITPQNEALVGFYGDTGVVLFPEHGSRQIARTLAHNDVMRDRAGDAILVRVNANDDPNLKGCNNGIEAVRLADGKVTCLWPMGWNPLGGAQSLACHISCPDNTDGKQNFCIVSTYNPNNKDDPEPNANCIIQVALDGSGIKNLGKHGADSKDYGLQPKASVSHDGREYVYDSQGAVYVGSI